MLENERKILLCLTSMTVIVIVFLEGRYLVDLQLESNQDVCSPDNLSGKIEWKNILHVTRISYFERFLGSAEVL